MTGGPMKRYKVWVWQAAAFELEEGETALKITGPGLSTIAEDARLAKRIETFLNAKLREKTAPSL
jgi:hypothetical protein